MSNHDINFDKVVCNGSNLGYTLCENCCHSTFHQPHRVNSGDDNYLCFHPTKCHQIDKIVKCVEKS